MWLSFIPQKYSLRKKLNPDINTIVKKKTLQNEVDASKMEILLK